MDRVDTLIEQLWAPALADGLVRVVLSGDDPQPRGTDPDWQTKESYWLVPDAARARMLLPVGPPAVNSRSLTNYRAARRLLPRVGRMTLGMVARTGVPLSRSRLLVQVRAGSDPVLPLRLLAEVVGVDRVYGSMGVRTSPNRKVTMQILDAQGSPRGYAKFGWSSTTDAAVATEAEALAAAAGGTPLVRTPRLLGTPDWHGHRVAVTSPLPLDVRGARQSGVADPTARELYELCPVVRRDRISASGQFAALRLRLADLQGEPVVGKVAGEVASLLQEVAASDLEVPVSRRWHGDLSPWNRARDSSGTLWLWDWESSEEDALTGMDALHWELAVRRPPSGAFPDVSLAECVTSAAPQLLAGGVARTAWPHVAAVFLATMIERVASIAAAAGTWDGVWLRPDRVGRLLEEARAALRTG